MILRLGSFDLDTSPEAIIGTAWCRTGGAIKRAADNYSVNAVRGFLGIKQKWPDECIQVWALVGATVVVNLSSFAWSDETRVGYGGIGEL